MRVLLKKYLLPSAIACCLALVGAYWGLYGFSYAASAPSNTVAAPAEIQFAKGKGLNAGELFSLEPTELAVRVQQLRQLGVKWVRLGFEWQTIQPLKADAYDWSRQDRVVTALAAADIRILGLLAYTPPWANGGQTSKYFPPVDPNAFARFAQEAALRYSSDRVPAWEIWNEPNLGNFWRPAANVGDYAQLLKLSATAIRKASPVALILSGGLGQPYASKQDQDARQFLQALYTAGAGPYFDAVSNHPYTTPHRASSLGGHNWLKMTLGMPSMRKIMADHGDDNKKIWITEFGAPTSGKADYDIKVDEATQAALLTDVYSLAAKTTWSGPVFWYDLQDFCPVSANNTTECYYGLLRYDGTPKPAFNAYREIP